ncbi:MAG: YARHG domain-containing protein [Treponema sp.]|nr:YARHG domain-containing protein [Treponema sp.]
MKKIIILLVFLISTGLFAQDFSVFHDENERTRHTSGELSILSFYEGSIFEFSSIFSSNALRILLGEVDILASRWVQLDIFSLAQLDNRNLRLLRNMIYARHGLRFNSADLTSYFRQFDWYNPRLNNVDNLLTDVDKWHIGYIQAYESRNENLPNITLNNPIGFWHDSPAVAASYGERFIFHPNNRLEFYFSNMQNMPIASRLNGTYLIRGNVLIYSVTEIYFVMNNADIRRYTWGNSWVNSTENKLTLERPIIYKFPVSGITTSTFGTDRTLETLEIGGRKYFKFSNNVNYGR